MNAHLYLDIPDLERRWMPRAACIGEPLESFFHPDVAPGKKSVSPETMRVWTERKLICRECPVLAQCRRDTMGEDFGIWGGFDPIERRSIRRSRGAIVRQLPVPEVRPLARFAQQLDASGHFPMYDLKRVLAMSQLAVSFLVDWREDVQMDPFRTTDDKGRLTAQTNQKILALRREGVSQREIAERLGVTLGMVQHYLRQVDPRLAHRGGLAPFPSNPPRRGDGWIRYDNRCTAAWYVAETEDGTWVQVKMRAGYGDVVGWVRKDDVKLTRPVARVLKAYRRPERNLMYGKAS